MLKLLTSQKIFLASILSKTIIFFLGPDKRIVKRNKILYEVDINEGIDLGIFLNFKNERKIFNLTNILDPKGKCIMLDIGANVGSVSLPLAKIYQKSKIYSIEPTYYAFKKLKRNIDLNPKLKKRVVALNYLINNENKSRNVYSSWNFNSNEHKHKIHLGTLKEINNKNIISLDQMTKKINQKIDFIKLDVDGFELKVLKSGRKNINKFKPIIHMEFAPYLHKEFKYSSKSLISFIKKDLNYVFYDEDFREVKNIYNYVRHIKKRSENFFLIHKTMKQLIINHKI